MNPRDALNVIRKVAPAAASVLGTPLAGAATAIIASHLGTEPTPTAIAQTIQANPESAIKIASLEADLAKAAMADVQDARIRNHGHWMTWLVPLILLTLFAAAGASVFLVEVPLNNQRIADLLLGSLLGMTASGVAYWVGSSSGSAAKQAQLDARK